MNQEAEIQRMLQNCSLHAHLILLTKVLSRSGYGDVTVLDRRQTRQRSRFGGCELLCQTTVGPSPIKIIVKVIKDFVRIRMMDELAGAIDRTKSDFGILVTPFDLTEPKRKLQGVYGRSRVEVIDGPLFARMLMQYRIGVRPSGEPDYDYFDELENQSDLVMGYLGYVSDVR